STPYKYCQPKRTEHFTEQTHGHKRPAAFGDARHFQVDNAIQADNHAEARKDLGVILQRHTGITKEPLWVEGGVRTPGESVDASGAKDEAMQPPMCDHPRA